MPQIDEFSEEQRKVLGTIEKLLRLADKNPNGAEAAAAAAKAQELLLTHNLSADMVDTGDKGRREETKVRGGFYQYQVDLWAAVADLNFCMYFTSGGWKYIKKSRKRYDGTLVWEERVVWEKRHRMIGRVHNIAGTKVMAQYLEQAVERLLMERLNGQNNLRFSRYAVSYREGAIADIISRIRERRREMIAEEERQAAENAEAFARAKAAGASTSTTVSIASKKQTERDGNMDFLHGEGWSAEQRAKRAAAAQAQAEAEAAYTAWAAANPEEARKQAEEERKESLKRSNRRVRYSSGTSKEVDWSAYRAGGDAAKSIGIDPQAGGKRNAGLL